MLWNGKEKAKRKVMGGYFLIIFSLLESILDVSAFVKSTGIS